jgi:hypothetical protein
VAYGAQVHHLIEKCICYNMDREECMETLQKHANIKPVITSTGTCTSYLLRCCFDYCRNSESVYNFLPFSTSHLWQCGRSWRRRTGSSSRPTRRIEGKSRRRRIHRTSRPLPRARTMTGTTMTTTEDSCSDRYGLVHLFMRDQPAGIYMHAVTMERS